MSTEITISSPPVDRFICRLSTCKSYALRVPDKFRNTCFRPAPRHVTLSTSDLRIWTVKVMFHNGSAYLAKGWGDFHKHYALKRWDYLIFEYDHDSHFLVSIFLHSGDEIKFPHAVPETDEEVEVESKKKSSSSTITLDDTLLAESSDEEDKITFVGMQPAWICGRCKSTVTKEVPPDGAKRIRKLPQRVGAQSVMSMDPTKSPYIPHFLAAMHVSTISKQYRMKIDLDFATSQLVKGDQTRYLKVKGKGLWRVTATLNARNASISEGWEEFVAENKIQLGDVLCIERNLKDPDTWNVFITKK